MPVEFALRPRIRLREDLAPPRRVRLRLPRFVLPVAGYWLLTAGAVYGFVHWHDAAGTPPSADEPASAAAPAPVADRAWWQRTPAAIPQAAEPPAATEPAPEPSTEPAAALEQPPEPTQAAEPAADTAPTPRDALRARAPAPVQAAHDELRTRAPAAEPAVELEPALNFIPAPAPAPAPARPPDVPPAHGPRVSAGLPSCEAAIAAANQDVDFSQGNRTADLPTQAIAAVLENGAWLSSCNVLASTSIEVCVAIRGGNVVGASVSARPGDAALSSCVRRRAAALQFPYSPHLDIARTRF